MTSIIYPRTGGPAESCLAHCIIDHIDRDEAEWGVIHRSATDTVTSRLRFGTIDDTLVYEVAAVQAEGEPPMVLLDSEALTPEAVLDPPLKIHHG